MKLSEVRIGDTVIIDKVNARSVDRLVLLVGIVKGIKVKVISSTGRLIEIEFYGTRFVMTKRDAANIIVV